MKFLKSSLITTIFIATCKTVFATTVFVSGHITTYQYGLNDVFSIGQPYSIEFTWTGPGENALTNPSYGLYPDAGINLVLSTTGYSITSENVAYSLRDMPGVPDAFYIQSANWLTTTIAGSTLVGSKPISNERFPYYIGIEFDSDSETALTSTTLTDPLPDIEHFQRRQVVIGFAKQTTNHAAFDTAFAYGTIDSISTVPEPSSRCMLLAALVMSGLFLNITRVGLTRRSSGLVSPTGVMEPLRDRHIGASR